MSILSALLTKSLNQLALTGISDADWNYLASPEGLLFLFAPENQEFLERHFTKILPRIPVEILSSPFAVIKTEATSCLTFAKIRELELCAYLTSSSEYYFIDYQSLWGIFQQASQNELAPLCPTSRTIITGAVFLKTALSNEAFTWLNEATAHFAAEHSLRQEVMENLSKSLIILTPAEFISSNLSLINPFLKRKEKSFNFTEQIAALKPALLGEIINYFNTDPQFQNDRTPLVKFLNLPVNPLKCLITMENQLKILERWFTHNFADFITVLADICIQEGPDRNTTALYWLARSIEGRALLNQLADKPDFKAKIIQANWDAGPEEGLDRNTTALFWLASSPLGQELLNKLLTDDSSFRAKISQANWDAGPEEGPDRNTAALYWLARSPLGRALLNQLADDPGIRAKISQANWDAGPAEGPKRNTTALYWFAKSVEGRALLNQLADEPGFKAKIIQANWDAGPEEGPDRNATVFYCFVAIPEGRALLNKLAEEPSFIAKISQVNWDVGPQEDPYRGITALYCLALIPSGQALLNKLADDPDFRAKISQANWDAGPVEGSNRNTTVFYCLTRSPSGLALLNKLANDPSCRAKISQANWDASPEEGPDCNTNALYWLARSPLGRALLNQLADDPGIRAKISQANWDAGPVEGLHRNTTALFWLASSPLGQELLNKLLTDDSSFRAKISQANWDACLVEGLHRNTTALYLLARSPLGHALLNQLADDPDFTAKIIQANWNAGPEEGLDRNTTALFWLAGLPKGRVFLNRLADVPEFRAKIIQANWDAGSEEDSYRNTTALYRFASSKTGLEFLNKLADELEFRIKILQSDWGIKIACPGDKLDGVSFAYAILKNQNFLSHLIQQSSEQQIRCLLEICKKLDWNNAPLNPSNDSYPLTTWYHFMVFSRTSPELLSTWLKQEEDALSLCLVLQTINWDVASASDPNQTVFSAFLEIPLFDELVSFWIRHDSQSFGQVMYLPFKENSDFREKIDTILESDSTLTKLMRSFLKKGKRGHEEGNLSEEDAPLQKKPKKDNFFKADDASCSAEGSHSKHGMQ